MPVIVTKFGGSSLADASQFRKVKQILNANAERRFCVPSAPGRRFAGDAKITDLLYELYDQVCADEDYAPTLDAIQSRYVEIAQALGLALDIQTEIAAILDNLKKGASRDYAASRGEYLNGKLLAEYLGWDFIDADHLIVFDRRGRYDDNATHILTSRVLSQYQNGVIPGFYGSLPTGEIKTFSRGGSDITGAIVAAAIGADLYENWTDVSGFLMADPRIVENPGKIETITYRELRELAYMGATVLHEDSIFPVYNAAIPINIRNTNAPEDPGTMIVPTVEEPSDPDSISITAVAGRKNFTAISIEKNGMNSELGFGRKVLACV